MKFCVLANQVVPRKKVENNILVLRSLWDGAGHQIARHDCRIHASPPYCLRSDIRWKAEKVASIEREQVFLKHIGFLFILKVNQGLNQEKSCQRRLYFAKHPYVLELVLWLMHPGMASCLKRTQWPLQTKGLEYSGWFLGGTALLD